MTPVKINKLDAARRQLHTAIELWFADGDPVSIHALAFAAYEVLHRLAKNQGHKGLIFDSPAIKPEDRKTFALSVKQAAGFFKHADRDPDRTLDFNPELTTLFLLGSVGVLQVMGMRITDTEFALIMWHDIHSPELFIQTEFLKGAVPIEPSDEARRIPKSAFLQTFFELLREQGN